MSAWQLIAIAVVVLLPLLLLVAFHPRRERLTARGAPLERGWFPEPPPAIRDEHH
ncbi:MAG: hypothetical protein WD638_11260 [Nitriliruptoraceae bacterium]